MTDQNKKSLRQFQCRDYLWEIFEQMSGELECSVDYLINEAMRQYARSRNYGASSGSGATGTPGAGAGRGDPTGPARLPAPASMAPAAVGGPGSMAGMGPPVMGLGGVPAPVAGARARIPSQPSIPSAPPPPQPRQAQPQQGYGQPPQPQPNYGYGQPQPQPAYPAPPSRSSPGGYPAPPQPQGYGGYPPAPQPQPQQGYGQPNPGFQQPAYPAPPVRSSFPPPPTNRPPTLSQPGGPAGAPPPLPGGPLPGNAPPGYRTHADGMPTLFVIFNGQKYPVNKEEFIIGRGAKTADLPIKDGNISRRHAAIIFQNGAFYMKDLGSTNGVEYQGRRVDGRHIQEGDVYQLCDYELRFTYR
jgi:hypothetical protein